MKNNLLFFFVSLLLFSCSHKKQITYLNDLEKNSLKRIDLYHDEKIEMGDVLKIDVVSSVVQASVPYNNDLESSSLDILIIKGYSVSKDSTISFPVLGEIKVVGFTERELANQIKKYLVDGGHLNSPSVTVKQIGRKFTILGEVNNPGTFSNIDKNLNIFQAIGKAGDLAITAKRKNIKLIREENGVRKSYIFSLSSSGLLDKPYYYIKNNDVIIVEPNFSKVKSAGFIGNPSSIASIASLALSVTLLLLNK